MKRFEQDGDRDNPMKEVPDGDWVRYEDACASREVDHLALANKVTKALFPDLYGKPGLSTEQVALLMGSRQIIWETLARELPNDKPEQS